MQYHFDELIDRRNTDSIKWDHIPENPDAIPMWVADMAVSYTHLTLPTNSRV